MAVIVQHTQNLFVKRCSLFAKEFRCFPLKVDDLGTYFSVP